MASTSRSPGVYTNELDLSQAIAAASTSIGAIVGASDKGPVMERTLVTSVKNFVSMFGAPNPATSYLHYAALQFLTQSSMLYVTRVIQTNATLGQALTAGAYWTVDDVTASNPVIRLNNFDDGTNQPLGKYDPYNTLGFDPATPAIGNVMGFFCAQNPGTWNNDLMINIKPSTVAGTSSPDDPTVFWVEVYQNYTSPRQTPVESFLVSRGPKLDGFGAQMDIEQVINTQSNYIRYRANPYCTFVLDVLMTAPVFLDGGTNGAPLDGADLSPSTTGLVAAGWELYRDPEHVTVNILINGGYSTPAVQYQMDDLCQTRMDCIAVLDIPSTMQEVATAMNYKTNTLNLDSSRSAIYSPDLLIYDQYNDRRIYVPPSGFAAAAYAHTDHVAETWFAPAGMSRGDMSILGVRKTYNQGDRDALVLSQINPMRVFPGLGYKIWGADTMQSMTSALSNVNVRRLLNFVEKSISVAALYSVFDPNDQILWAFLRNLCERLLAPIQRGRGLYKFEVICDETNNTPATIAAGSVILDVYLDPVIPAKRILLNAVILKTGTNYKELIAAQNINS